jgi:hypothetical protein
MKTLQNNFTTPEQSKRLLELGVPAWTADCYYVTSVGKKPNIIHNNLDFDLKSKATQKPCWSVGRLIEIYHICVSPGCSFTFHVCFQNLMNEIMYKLAEANSNGWLDLSKLEESYV